MGQREAFGIGGLGCCCLAYLVSVEDSRAGVASRGHSCGRRATQPRAHVRLCIAKCLLITGFEVASKVRQLGCPVYIVGCTGNALRQDQEEYIEAGAGSDTHKARQAGQYRRVHCGGED